MDFVSRHAPQQRQAQRLRESIARAPTWLACAALGEKARAAEALEKLAHVNSLNQWQFNE